MKASLMSRHLWCALLAVVAAMTAAPGFPADTPARWDELRPLLFQTRPIDTDRQDVVQLFVPRQAEDAAVVPVLIRTRFEQTPQRFVRNLYLVIDNNPSPVSATFHLTPESGRADIETRVRIERYSAVRAIAELNDGELFMATHDIIASGGCSSPALKDAAGQANVGKMKFRLDDAQVDFERPALAQIMINHPNWSGLAADGPSAQFIKQMAVYYQDRMILSADMDFSISENPNFRFYFLPRDQGELRAEMIDTADLRYTTTLKIDRLGRAEAPAASVSSQ